jgi:glycosyltransferase involved in cell wall biosynthesis
VNSPPQPVISIIVPVFNSAGHLADCIKRILSQTFTAFECILVDDGSTDESLNICQNYSKLDNRIKILHQNNAGVSSARNTGLNNCTGEYIGFVDSDDTVFPEMYQTLYKNITVKNHDVICCGFKHKENEYSAAADFERQSRAETVYFLENAGLFGTVWNKLYKREIIEKNNIRFSEGYSFGEDFLFNLTFFSFASSVLCISDVLYEYNINERSVSKNRPGFAQSLYRFKKVNKQILQLTETAGKRFRGRILALDFTYTVFLIRNIYVLHNQYRRISLLSEIKSFYKTNAAFYSFRSFRYRFFYFVFIYMPLIVFDTLAFLFFQLLFYKRKYV